MRGRVFRSMRRNPVQILSSTRVWFAAMIWAVCAWPPPFGAENSEGMCPQVRPALGLHQHAHGKRQATAASPSRTGAAHSVALPPKRRICVEPHEREDQPEAARQGLPVIPSAPARQEHGPSTCITCRTKTSQYQALQSAQGMQRRSSALS